MAKKKLVFYGDSNKRNKSKKKPTVVVGTGGSENIWYSLKLQQEISSIILNQDLRCSIMQFEHVVNWGLLCSQWRFSEELLDIFSDRVHWGIVSSRRKLSEKIMDKHADKLNWMAISRNQHVKKDFIFRHFNELNIEILIERKLITVDDLDKREVELKEKRLEEKRDEEDITNRFDMMDME